MKIRTWLSKDFNSFVSNSGDGHAVPQFELNEKTMLLQVKKTKDGKRVVHDLYADIQKFKDVNSLERILKLAQDGDIEKLDFRCATEQEARAKDVDYTKIVDAEHMKDVENKLARQGKTLTDLQNSIIALIKAQQSAAKNSTQEVVNKKAEKTDKEVIENVQKDKK